MCIFFKSSTVDCKCSPLLFCFVFLRNAVRYEFTHEVLKEQESYWRGKKIPRDRRIALLMRCEPDRA